jgi:hypothetical protein
MYLFISANIEHQTMPPLPGKHLELFLAEKKTSSFLSRCR